MPILAKEPDLYPEDLLDRFVRGVEDGEEQIWVPDDGPDRWWALYTLARQEKMLMRKLKQKEIAFFGPLIPKRYRSPGGRFRTSYSPLFPGYVFIHGDEFHRYESVTTNCVSQWFPVVDQVELVRDLRRVKKLMDSGAPLTPEARLQKGDRVRVRSGPFKGLDGFVIRRQKETRLLVWVHYTQRGVSAVLEDCELEPI